MRFQAHRTPRAGKRIRELGGLQHTGSGARGSARRTADLPVPSVYLRPPCHFFRNGTGHCMAGDSCRFSHDIVPDNDEDDQQQGDEYDIQQEAVKAEQPPIPVPEVVHEVHAEHQTDQFNEPYFGGINGDHLSVAGPRMELVVSEGEEEEEDDDVVVLKPSISKSRFDADNKDVEKLFASLSVANVA